MKMNRIALAALLGLIFGISLGVLISPVFHAATKHIPSNATKYVEYRLTRLIQYTYPNASVKVSSVEPLGKLYLITLDIIEQNRTLAEERLFMSENGSLLFVNNPSCIMNLNSLKVNIKAGNDPSIGNHNAKVTIIVFSDYLCPYCAKFAEVEKIILKKYKGEVRFVHKDFPVHGTIAIKAAEAARCAGEQGKYWEYHNILFKNQKEWMSNTSMFYIYAKELGLNLTKFKECLESEKYLKNIERDVQEGKKYGVTGTPTIFVNGWRVSGYISEKALSKLIEEELK